MVLNNGTTHIPFKAVPVKILTLILSYINVYINEIDIMIRETTNNNI